MAHHRDACRPALLQQRGVAAEMDHVAMPRFQSDDDSLAVQRFTFPERAIEGLRKMIELPARIEHVPALLETRLAQQQIAQVEARPRMIGIQRQRFAITGFALRLAMRAHQQHA